jgi:RimJ/RimL family protein N-acetyltransferase
MSVNKISVRELSEKDIAPLIHYWLDASPEFMRGMGVDLSKIPSAEDWKKMLSEQLSLPVPEKKSYCLIWEIDGVACGHSNISKIIFGEEAYMHLHLWKVAVRQQGAGTELVKKTIPIYFEKYKLKKLLCEPYAFNPAPNKTLPKLGFDFVKRYTTIPGWINFEQEVNLWEMSSEKFSEIYSL